MLFGRQINYDKASVPYSCCAKNNLAPCKHDRLLETSTINTVGCVNSLVNYVKEQLYLQLSISGTCITVGLLVLVVLFKTSKTKTIFLKQKW